MSARCFSTQAYEYRLCAPCSAVPPNASSAIFSLFFWPCLLTRIRARGEPFSEQGGGTVTAARSECPSFVCTVCTQNLGASGSRLHMCARRNRGRATRRVYLLSSYHLRFFRRLVIEQFVVGRRPVVVQRRISITREKSARATQPAAS